MRHLLPSLILLLLPLFSSCEKNPPTAANEEKLRIVTSFLPLQSHALAISGGRAEVLQLLDQETGPHDFQFSPADVAKLSCARLLLVNGIGLESWLDDLVNAAGAKPLEVVDTSRGMTLTENATPLDGSPEAGANPHVWLDPRLALAQAKNVLAAMIAADPGYAAEYEKNAAEYFAKLEALDEEFATSLAPLKSKNLVTFHDAFPYLAERYGITYLGSFNAFPGKDPTPQELAGLIEKIRDKRVEVLFSETGYAPDLLVEIARQTGAKIAELDTLEVGAGTAEAYLTRMRTNLNSLAKAFE